jgi:hypothetical protein
MKNKLEKFLIIISSFSAVALISMGFKIQNDKKQIEKLTASTVAEPMADMSPVVIEDSSVQDSDQLMIGDTIVKPSAPDPAPTTIIPVIPTPAPTPVKKTKTS